MTQPLTDPREMRARLSMAAHRGERIDGDRAPALGSSAPSLLARSVFIQAERDGLSGEDKMTILAYHALRLYEDCLDRLLDSAFLAAHRDNG